MKNINDPLKDNEALKKLIEKKNFFTNKTHKYIKVIRGFYLDGEVEKKRALIELKYQKESLQGMLEELKVYQDKINSVDAYRELIMDCKYAINDVNKEILLYENDIIPEAKSKPQVNNIQPIHWLKGEESLRQFLESIKSAGLIENRDTDEIIQEHFLVDGKAPNKKLQLIKWLSESKYLAYLMHRLAEEFIINIKGRKHELTASHFISSKETSLNTNSLASQLSKIYKNGKSSDKNLSTIENIIQKVKS